MITYYYSCKDSNCEGSNEQFDKDSFEEGRIYCQFCGKKLVLIEETF